MFSRRKTIGPSGRPVLAGALLAAVVLTPTVLSTPGRRPGSAVQRQERAPAAPRSIDVKLGRGDTLLSVLARFGLDRAAAHAMVESVRPFVDPRRLRAGESVRLLIDPADKKVQGFAYTQQDDVVRVTATERGWAVERNALPFVRVARVVRGTIGESLYRSGTEAGLTPLQVMELANIFEYDIDFFSDFHPGDRFAVVFEEVRYGDGRREPARLLAAELEAGGEPFQAFYFAGRHGGSYFDADGQPLRRAFLRAPLSYRRISSTYDPSRRHPIFRTLRPHLAIDYAAPAGTPVVAIGGGQVTFAGWRGGYGNLVELRHPNGYVTRYAHFSRIARGIRKGKRVDQGEVVGFVGETGHATGPHLHFEILRNGQKLNFLSLRIPRAERLVGAELERFTRGREKHLALLYGAAEKIARQER
ncbi:MAG TPA: peptidoglycan DD-metalloendopeptidase family protein [Candidatus Acidoferrales bacterium]|nr:peptidoglycan DD-metalloendopeptidase family protein [Candidatus Acidoferrales bacterium]